MKIIELGLNDGHCQHKIPYHISNDDKFSNLVVLHEAVHRLVHLKVRKKIGELLINLQLNQKQINKVNDLRKQCQINTI